MQPTIDQIAPELKFTTSRSGGPGGQNVNKLNTRVTLRWEVAKSAALSPEQKETILTKLANYINNNGELILSARESRSQWQNKEAVVNRLEVLLAKAFHKPKPRKPTRPTRASVQKRLDEKKKQAAKKRWRRGPDD